MKRVALEAFDAGHPGKLRRVEGAIGHDDEAGAQGIPAVRGDHPFLSVLVPSEIRDSGVEEGAVVKIVVAANAPSMLEDFRLVGEFMAGDIAHFLAKRKVDGRFRIAGSAGIAVPVPGAAEVAAVLKEAEVGKARLLQARRGDEASEAAADNEDFREVLPGRPGRDVAIGVFGVVGQGPFDAPVLIVALGA